MEDTSGNSVPASGNADDTVTTKVNGMDEDEEKLVRLQEESIQLQQDKIRLQEERLQLLEEKLQLRREKNQALAEQRTLLETKKRKVPPSTYDGDDELKPLQEKLALQEKELEAQAITIQQQGIKLQELTKSSTTQLQAVVIKQHDTAAKEGEPAPAGVATTPAAGGGKAHQETSVSI